MKSIGKLFVKWLNNNHYCQMGLKVKNKRTGHMWILAATRACYYQWINTETGEHWGDAFFNDQNPLCKIKDMDYEFIIPDIDGCCCDHNLCKKS